MTRAVSFALVALVALTGGCLWHPIGGHFTGDAFYQARGQYRVRSACPNSSNLLPPPWEIATFSLDDDGEPTREIVDERFVELHDLSWHPRGERLRPMRVARYDFVYTRGANTAVWARSVPLQVPTGQERLAVVLRRAIGGIGSSWPDILGIAPRSIPRVDVRAHGPAIIGGERAETATFDLVSSRPSGIRIQRVTAAIVRPGLSTYRFRGFHFPALVVFGFASSPVDHHAWRPAFDDMLTRVELRVRSSSPGDVVHLRDATRRVYRTGDEDE